MNFLSIDPSVNNVGFAILQVDDGKIVGVNDQTYYPASGLSLQTKCEMIERKINKIIAMTKEDYPCQVIIEYPQFMAMQRGIIAAQQGYTLDLAFICGYLGRAFLVNVDDFYLYTPIQWKGTKPKTATLAAFKRLFPKINPDSEHSVDAVMLGYHHLKKMKYLKP